MTETAGFPWIGLHRSTIIGVIHTFEIDGARIPDQVEQIVEWIAPGRTGKFIRETLDAKRVIDVCYRAQPADAHMGFRGTILYTEIWQIVRNIRPPLLKMGRVTINRSHVKDGRNGRKDRPLQPRGWFAVRTHSRLHIH